MKKHRQCRHRTSRNAIKWLNSIETIQPRMMIATLSGNPSTTIISRSSPTNASDETDLITFYKDISSLVRSIPKHNVVIICKDKNNKYCLHNSSNRNGEHLTEFSLENRLTCLNTKFQKMMGKLWTYTYANNAKAQIDYILTNKKWINSALNYMAYSSFKGVSSITELSQ